MQTQPPLGFVADIGGTNARFATIDPETLALSSPKTYPSRNFGSLPSAVAAYVATLPTRPRIGCIAVAGPIAGQAVRLTNLGWSSTLDELRSVSGVDRLVLVNDFEALALSLPLLGEADLLPIGMAAGELGGARAVLGPGTGLGVAGLVRTPSAWKAVPSEGGHASFSARDVHELAILRRLRPAGHHVSAEHVLSGPGLVRLYSALATRGARAEPAPTPEHIVRMAEAGTDPSAVRAIALFASWLARFAGDVALMFGARGGVYLGGGIPPKIRFALTGKEFRASFEEKGRLSEYLSSVPVSVILAADAGLRGAGVAMQGALEADSWSASAEIRPRADVSTERTEAQEA
jgi:glucokinase